MTSIFSAVSYIKDVLEGNRSYTGTAVYRSSEDEFVKYKTMEWEAYHLAISPWEIERYAHLF